jgi:hypothetical protein
MARELTNEEQRVVIYQDGDQPTNPAEVNHDTPLELLNLSWTERDMPQSERTRHVHKLHPYLGKYIPQLVEVFLRKYFTEGQTVLDPFAGSGTTLVQANELGLHAIGYDISAFNVMLCGVKTTQYDLERVHDEVSDTLKQTQRSDNDWGDLPLFAHITNDSEHFRTNNEYLKMWYAPQALSELIAYKQAIDNGDYQYKDLLRVILSRAARSARLTTHFDLDFPKKPQTEPYWCYKHSRTCEPTTDAFKFLKRYSTDALRRINKFAPLQTNKRVEIHHADSSQATFPPIDGVITSPPYVGLIDYHEQHAYAYHLLDLQDRREDEIGSAALGASKQAKADYQSLIARVFENALKAMPTGGRLIVVAGDKANLYDEIANRLDVEVEAIVQRHVNRRTGRRSSEFYESVFIWRKP